MLRTALLTLALLAPAAAQDVTYERFQLENGLTVILHEDHSLPQVVINVWYHVGSKDEPEGRSGFAHLFEHLMFRGTERVPDGRFDELMEVGGGYNNASTTTDRTNYYGQGPAELLPTLLWLEADRMRGLVITQDVLDAEREVVRNERRQNFEDRPYGPSALLESSLCYPPAHPYHRTVIGSHEDLEAATLDDVEEFFGRFYVPNNASLVVAGSFDPAQARAWIEEYFGGVPRGDDPVRPWVPTPDLEGTQIHTMLDRVPYARTSMLWHSPAFLSAGDAAMDLVASLLADGLNSRLHQALVVEAELAHEVGAYQRSRGLGSIFEVTALAREGVDLESLEEAVDRELRGFLEGEIDPAELERAKTGFEVSTLQGLEDLGRRADLLNRYQFHWQQPDGFKRDLDRYRSATPEECLEQARAVLGGGRVVLRVLPGAVAGAGVSGAGNQPEAAATAAFEAPLPQRFELSNGIPVELWTRPQLPLVEIGLLLPAGSALDPEGREGVAQMTAEMLDEGAGERSAREFASELERLGASFTTSVDRESTQLRLSALSRNLEASLGMFGDAVLSPRFLDEDWSRLQSEAIAARRLSGEDPRSIAIQAGQSLWFGGEHAYGRPAEGTPESLASIDLNDLAQYFTDTYRPEGARLFVAGDVERAEIEGLLEQTLGSWQGLLSSSGRHEPRAIGPPAGGEARFAIVDRPGSTQTFIRLTWPAVSREAPERQLHQLLATVLGGTFTSRLNQNLRIERGITYGASSALVLRPSASYCVAVTSVQAPHTATAISEIRRELERLAGGGVTEEEARKATAALRQSAIESFAGLGGVISSAAERATFGEGVERVAEELSSLASADAASMDLAAKSFVNLEGARWLLVGDGEVLRSALADIGEGSVIQVDVEGRPIGEPAGDADDDEGGDDAGDDDESGGQ